MLKISNFGWRVLSITTAAGILLLLILNVLWWPEAEVPLEIVAEPEPEPEPPIIIEVDGVGCVIAESPTLTYYVTTDTVRVTIECDSDILFHYLPAAPAEEL